MVRTVGLSDRLSHRPSELSGGQQQRVAVARAMATRPPDHLRRRAHRQPRLHLGRRGAQPMRSAVDDYGQTVVMVTHDPVAAGYAHQVIFLADGRVVGDLQQPTAEAVLDRMKGLGS
ncbi:MAG: ATP-binding cassette domain-containing protein [Microthrixaceae bacterium]